MRGREREGEGERAIARGRGRESDIFRYFKDGFRDFRGLKVTEIARGCSTVRGGPVWKTGGRVTEACEKRKILYATVVSGSHVKGGYTWFGVWASGFRVLRARI